ncbi:proline-rich protein 2-like [Poecile atricapillus]|uniref:proline-rich protein 2-like n=1 Tax=Poecile atricapillus TaxID=48891 RepID=UPI002738CA15|nr:proline-rich protein 2-like [Poecile atricapillus]
MHPSIHPSVRPSVRPPPLPASALRGAPETRTAASPPPPPHYGITHPPPPRSGPCWRSGPSAQPPHLARAGRGTRALRGQQPARQRSEKNPAIPIAASSEAGRPPPPPGMEREGRGRGERGGRRARPRREERAPRSPQRRSRTAGARARPAGGAPQLRQSPRAAPPPPHSQPMARRGARVSPPPPCQSQPAAPPAPPGGSRPQRHRPENRALRRAGAGRRGLASSSQSEPAMQITPAPSEPMGSCSRGPAPRAGKGRDPRALLPLRAHRESRIPDPGSRSPIPDPGSRIPDPLALGS